jgi:hypothetical protein
MWGRSSQVHAATIHAGFSLSTTKLFILTEGTVNDTQTGFAKPSISRSIVAVQEIVDGTLPALNNTEFPALRLAPGK